MNDQARRMGMFAAGLGILGVVLWFLTFIEPGPRNSTLELEMMLLADRMVPVVLGLAILAAMLSVYARDPEG